jgi:hypothetical protein
MSGERVDYGVRRYAVLQHSGVDEPHYDLLFETGETSSLVTFRLAEWPLTKGQVARKLKDHRRLYLTYEGEIPGGDRGRVDRVAEGQVRVTGGPGGWEMRHPDGRVLVWIEPDELDPSSENWWARTIEEGADQP